MMWVAMFCFVILCLYIFNKPQKHPPGPMSMPIFGNIFLVYYHLKKVEYQHMVWQIWKEKYGNIFKIKLGFTKVIVVSGRELIKEVSNNEAFIGRPSGVFYLIRSLGKKLGIVFSESNYWNNIRQLIMKCLKNFGIGTQTMEIMIADECKAFVELRLTDAGHPVCISQVFDVSLLNVLWRVVSGKRYDLKDSRLKKLCHLLRRAFKITDMSGGIINVMPFLRHIIPSMTGYTELVEIYEVLHGYIREIIKEHKDNIDINNPRDVIDVFLVEMLNQGTSDDLLVVCIDMFEAGLETVSNTLEFMLLYLVRNEDIQAHIQKEIDDVIGHSRAPSLKDKLKMAYTEAVVLETLRISTVAPVGIPHKAVKDVYLQNFFVPKDTLIFLNMYDLHLGDHWESPMMFQPNRFLTNGGKLFNQECILPFGTGKRRCIGEGLARSELFLFLTHLLQKFNLKLPQGDPLPSTKPINGVSLSPKPFRIEFHPRLHN